MAGLGAGAILPESAGAQTTEKRPEFTGPPDHGKAPRKCGGFR